jgi:hypothetical protein
VLFIGYLVFWENLSLSYNASERRFYKKKVVAFQVTGQGLVVYPEQEVFSEIA